MYFCKKSLLLSLFVTLQLILSPFAGAKGKCPIMGPKLSVEEYCRRYAAEAQNQMRKYGVPASVTLAQALRETANGSSYLAVVAHNHFGIKAYRSDWTGDKVYCDDDAKNEPFCAFPDDLAGYEYHSVFLRKNQRYARLFTLNIRDYEGWCRGLSECGYATDPSYATGLIKLIEDNHLDVYDILDGRAISTKHKLYKTKDRGGLVYIRCLAGDDLASIAYEYNISKRKLRLYNDLQKGAVLKEGDIIYLQHKHFRAEKGYIYHTVKAGESLHSISQIYGVRISNLMKRNKLVSATVHEGQVLKLR